MQWSQEEHGRIYYTLSEKAKQKDRPHQAFFREPVLNILYSQNLSYSSLPMLPTLD
jgi:hypothetical protein